MDEKIYKTIDERIEILKSRNMQIRKNATREIKILKSNNYYNLINGYKHLFLDYEEMKKRGNKEDFYRNGTKPSELYEIMQYDNNMRSIFLQYLLYIEEKVKHAIVQAFYENHTHENLHKEFEYLKAKYYNTTKTYFIERTNNKIHYQYTYTSKKDGIPVRSQTISESDYIPLSREKEHKKFYDNVTSVIRDQQGKKESIKSYKKNHGYVPLWILTNILTLGNISHLFIILKDSVAFRAMDILGITHQNKEEDLYNMYKVLGILTLYRNICAHNERFICTSHGKNIDDYFMDFGKSLPYYKDPKNHNAKLKKYQIKARRKCKHGMFSLVFSISIFLDNKERKDFVKRIKKEDNKINNRIKTIEIDILKKDIGLKLDVQKHVSLIKDNNINTNA
ncbi:Abi family protein [Staphylococcus schleiferi subsp. coagulans]|uniref:Abi family protein n=1 Tax=Staphylococcus coagulans TaxID=74706 RepID=UPI0015F90ECC|nr:Abi family protein [Staphylococcus coagulans]MBA8759844.1 Abi family protein [Staphylococcus coagulans]MBA8768717.1 Abi family protein [Staphylococcus coagulans]